MKSFPGWCYCPDVCPDYYPEPLDALMATGVPPDRMPAARKCRFRIGVVVYCPVGARCDRGNIFRPKCVWLASVFK